MRFLTLNFSIVTLSSFFTCASVFVSPTIYAKETKKHVKSHGAHEHGTGKINLVVEGNKLTAQLEVPSESIYGFEYEPKTETEKKSRFDAGEKLKSNIDKMIVLDPKLSCVFSNTKLDLHAQEKEEAGETPEA